MILVTAARVRIDADAEPIDDGAVLIDGDRIVDVGPRSQIALDPRAATVVDAAGLTVVPGFIDMHLHITTAGAGQLHLEMDKSPDEAERQGERNLANALSWGVTTVRDAGSWDDVVLRLRDRAASGDLLAPRVMPCGAPLTTPRGHLYWFGGEALGPDAAGAFVRRQAGRGMTHVKVMATGGWATKGSDPRLPQFSTEELRAVTGEARRSGVHTMAHLASLEGVRRSVAARVDTLEHCMFQGPDGTWEYPADLIHRIVDDGFWVDPTPAWHYRTVQSPPPGTSAERVAELRAVRAARIEVYQRLLAAGARRWLLGTDTGGTNPQDYYPLVWEIMAKEIGLGPRDILRAATSDAADALGLGRQIGRLGRGMSADLVALEGDPADDPMSAWRVRIVLARGRIVAVPAERGLATSLGGGWE
jgi:imidazolonepropionase-like amidohydrolase